MAKLSPVFNDQTFDANGDPASGYKVFTYAAGSSTKQTAYTDSAGLIPQTNPIILNASGYPTTGPIWLTAGLTYKFVLAASTDTDPPTSPLKTIDNVTGVNDSASSTSQWVSLGVTPTYVSPTSFTLAGDQTVEFHIGRRVQFTVNSGTVYGMILTSAFGALTTVTMSMDSGQVLDAGLSSLNVGLLRAAPSAVPSLPKLRVSDGTAFGYTDNTLSQVYRSVPAPTGIQQTHRVVTEGLGDNTTFKGVVSGYFEARDKAGVVAGTKGVLYALSLSVVPGIARNNVPYDDVDGLTISNTTGTVGAKATDGIYISNNTTAFGDKTTGTSEWYSIFTADCNADVGIALNGKLVNYAIDLKLANIVSGSAIRIPNNTSIVARDAGDASDRVLVGLTSGDVVNVGTGASRIDLKVAAIAVGGLQVTGSLRSNSGWFGVTAPVGSGGAGTYTVGATDNDIYFTGACTVTLPTAASFNGRILYVRTTGANAVTSASSNVVSLTGVLGTAILAATAGKWARLVSDGANWQIMAGN